MTLAMPSETQITWGARREFFMIGAPLGRNVVRMINKMETMRTPLEKPKITPNMRSTQPKKAISSKYLIIIPKILIMIKTKQNMIKKLNT
jgi:hypothetical protein